MKQENGKQIAIRFFVITLIIAGMIFSASMLLGQEVAYIIGVLLSFVMIKISARYNVKGKAWYPMIGGFLGLLVLGILLVIIDSLRS